MAIRLGQNGDLTGTPNVPWKYAKGTAYVPSPILYGDYLYLTTDRGILTCIDAKTGEVKYEGGRIPIPATFTASPVAFEGKILMTSEDGDTFIVKAGPKHEIHRHQFGWRACLRLAGNCRWPHLHPRREESLLHWNINPLTSV